MFGSSDLTDKKGYSIQSILWLGLAAILSLLVFVAWSAMTYRIGFPLDDAWIHQTYARNLALLGEWSFREGQLSGGSTSPMWTFLLAGGHILSVGPVAWAFVLGGILFWAAASVAFGLSRHLADSKSQAVPMAGLIFLLEWHMIWAALSGMETMLYILFVLVVFVMIRKYENKEILIGLLCGLVIWVRPDGLTLLAPVLIAIFVSGKSFLEKGKSVGKFLIGFGTLFGLYCVFNLIICGTPMPNTFYAKQVEYVAWQGKPLSERLLLFSIQFFQGMNLLLLPGFVAKIVTSIKKRDWTILLMALWVMGYSLIFLLQLPVYQHGRYLMPPMAIFLVIGTAGWIDLSLLNKKAQFGLIWGIVYVSFFIVLGASFLYGANAYSRDVAFIESQMVETAQWVSKNVPGDKVIAAHDIGALGYFSNNPLIDLAGLITPQVIPIMSDDSRVSTFLDKENVQYLVAFSAWRAGLRSQHQRVYIVPSRGFSQGSVGDMAVYKWLAP